jgi:hypothetical protein
MADYKTLNDNIHRLCGEVAHGCWDWLQVDDGGVLPDTAHTAAKAWAELQYAGCTMYGEIAAQATYAAMAACNCQISGDGMGYLSLLCELAPQAYAEQHREPQQVAGKLPEWPNPADVQHLNTCWQL